MAERHLSRRTLNVAPGKTCGGALQSSKFSTIGGGQTIAALDCLVICVDPLDHVLGQDRANSIVIDARTIEWAVNIRGLPERFNIGKEILATYDVTTAKLHQRQSPTRRPVLDCLNTHSERARRIASCQERMCSTGASAGQLRGRGFEHGLDRIRAY